MTDFAFLHGGGQGSWVWSETIAELKRQSDGAPRCIGLDVPGCGTKRGRITDEIGMEEVASELVADIVQAGMNDVVLVGHSQAGSVLPLMAASDPGLFQRIVYVSCLAPPTGRSSLEIMGDCRHGESDTEVGWPVDPETTTLEERFGAMFCNDMAATERDDFLARLGQDSWPAKTYAYSGYRYDHLGSISSPYIRCERDQALPPLWQDRFADRFKVDRVVSIDAGHQAMNTRPEELAALLLAEAALPA